VDDRGFEPCKTSEASLAPVRIRAVPLFLSERSEDEIVTSDRFEPDETDRSEVSARFKFGRSHFYADFTDSRAE